MAPSGSENSICGERASLEDEEDVYSEENYLTENTTPNSKPVRQSEDVEGFLSRGTAELDGGGWSALDEPLRERIIARLPFKSLFQAASLSKAWRLKFRGGSFQSEVHSSSAASWRAYAPLYVSKSKDLVGYENSSERWHVLPNLSYLQQDLVEDWWLRAGAGSLLCWTSAARLTYGNLNSMMYHSKSYHVHVTNPLTRSWRQLPNRPRMQLFDFVHVACEGTEAYKVMLVTLYPSICVQIFDSTTGSWTVDDTRCMFSRNCSYGGSALIQGVLITMVVDGDGCHLGSFDMTNRIWKTIPHNNSHQQTKFYCVRFSQVLVCGCNVMQVVAHWEHDEYTPITVISVFKVDLEHGLAVEVSRAPDDMGKMDFDYSASGHGDCIYIGGRSPSCRSILFNVMTQKWQWMNSPRDKLNTSFSDILMREWLWSSCVTYQPGLNPFLEV